MSVTAYPVILIDAAGSDSAASGAGPSTALTGSAAVSTGTTVVLDAGTNLSGVATDGSHVLYFADTTGGNRNFAAINGTSGSGGATPTVTVEQALASATKAWAIGGKRASLAGSKRLWNNNGSTADMGSGWKLRFSDGYTETLTETFRLRFSGSTAAGPCVVETSPGFTTKAVISINAADHLCEVIGSSVQLFNFDVKNIGSGASGLVVNNSNSYVVFSGVRVWGSATLSSDAVYLNGATGVTVEGCLIQNSGRYGINVVGDVGGYSFIGNTIDSPVSHGINIGFGNGRVAGNILKSTGGDGINNSINSSVFRSWAIIGNTIDGSAGDGIEFTAAADSVTASPVVNNIVTNAGGYVVNFSNASATASYLLANGMQLINNTWNSATSGFSNRSGVDSGTIHADPSYVGSGNFTPTNTSLKGTAYPTTFGTTVNYAYPGAIQPNSGGGAAGMLFVPNLEGT